MEELGERAREAMHEPDADLHVVYELRYRGQSFELAIPGSTNPEPEELRDAFESEHEERYGYRDAEQELELVTIRVTATAAGVDVELAGGDDEDRTWSVPRGGDARRRAGRARGAARDPVPGHEARRPGGGRAARVDAARPAGLDQRGRRHRHDPYQQVEMSQDKIDPVELQVLTGALRAVCEEMGAVLIRSAHSANIKERRDASTALFDPRGEMVMQAEHIPVHLGAMPAAVAAILDEEHAPDRSWILNDPYAGGTHLPDITVITPLFADDELIAFAASRAHHADVGGPTPGSMPADSTTLEDEGVVISPRVLDEEAIAELSEQMRQPDQRRADLRAQLAAGRVGGRRLLELHERYRRRQARAGVRRGARLRRAPHPRLHRGARGRHATRPGTCSRRARATSRSCSRATVDGDRLTLDFTGTADQHEGNLNCPLAVTRSACYFAIRVLTDPDIPPSAGAYRPVEVIAPEGCLLNARPPAAVVGGNVETSSRVADVVLQAFGRALGQGTMNNVTLGSDDVVYYETIGGGQGACPDADGPSGVHVAMSNTLNTPVEALELEFPMRMIEYALRRDSGGDGAFHGGDGVVRELEALAAAQLLADHRAPAPRSRRGRRRRARGRRPQPARRGGAAG